MATITADSTVAELMKALQDFASRRGFRDLQLTISSGSEGGGVFTIAEPEYATEDRDEFEAGDLTGFFETWCGTEIEELDELLAQAA